MGWQYGNSQIFGNDSLTLYSLVFDTRFWFGPKSKEESSLRKEKSGLLLKETSSK